MRQAIATKYLGPTDTRPAMVVAKCQAGKLTVPWDYALDQDDNHTRAAMRLAAKLSWSGAWFGGGSPDCKGNVYVMAEGARLGTGDFNICPSHDGAGYES